MAGLERQALDPQGETWTAWIRLLISRSLVRSQPGSLFDIAEPIPVVSSRSFGPKIVVKALGKQATDGNVCLYRYNLKDGE
jgi:hypothetical protein